MKELGQLFYERGLPGKLLTGNGPCYQSKRMKDLMLKWNVEHILSCAYRASGNGIVKHHHRTVKRMMARSGGTAQEMLYWYNISPRSNGVPAAEIYRYDSQAKLDVHGNSIWHHDTRLNPYKVGDEVYVKPHRARCVTPWSVGKVTSLAPNTANSTH